jgi:hypothetical protein
MPKKQTLTDRPRFRSTTNRPSFDTSNWEPLLALVGTELASWFMWMGAIELSDGATVQAFKHQSTRQYLHLAEDGRAFYYDWDGKTAPNPSPDYVEIDRGTLLFWVLRGWDTTSLGSERRDIEDAMDRAYDAADQGLLLEVDPNELRLQREFEARRDEERRAS